MLFQTKINNIFFYLILLFFSMLFLQCEEEEERYISKLPVVNCMFSNQDSVYLHLSLSKSTTEPEPNHYINDAKVEIISPDNTIHTLAPYDVSYLFWGYRTGYYKLNNTLPEQEGEYTLKILLADGSIVYASDEIPPCPEIKSMDAFRDSLKRKVFINLSFNDPPGIKNYYAITAMVTDYYEKSIEVLDNLIIHSNTTYVEAEITAAVPQIVFSDKTFEENSQNILIETSDYFIKQATDSSILTIRLNAISEDFYKYALSYSAQQENEKDFYAEPINVFCNISSGYGIFAGYSYTSKSIRYINE